METDALHTMVAGKLHRAIGASEAGAMLALTNRCRSTTLSAP